MEILKKVQQFDQKSYNPKYAYFYTKITKKLRIWTKFNEKAFISTGGFDHKMGLTTYFDYEAGIKREMINSARQIILVADSTKFGKISVNHFAEIEDFDIIITDDGLPDEYRKIISDQGIELIIASLQDGN